MYRLHFAGITAGALATDFVMADDTVRFHRTLIVGVSAFYPTGPVRKRRKLPWPPLTVFVDFDQTLVAHAHNAFGYGLSIGFDGVVNLAHPLQFHTNKWKATHLIQATRNEITFALRIGIERFMPALWRAKHAQLTRVLVRYRQRQTTLDELLDRLELIFATTSPSQQLVGARLIASAWQRARLGERRLDQLVKPVFLITHTQAVGNGMYAGPAFAVIKANLTLEEPDHQQAGSGPHRNRLFKQYLATQQLLQAHQIPLPLRQIGQHYWTVADLHNYRPDGILSM